MYSARRTAVLPAVGFPIRVSTDHRLFSAYSWLIAAVHALRRLLVPRHPPCALDILTVIFLDLPAADKAARTRPHQATAGWERIAPHVLRKRAVPVFVDDCAVFKVRPRTANGRGDSAAAWSLKTQQHAGTAFLIAAPHHQIRSTYLEPAGTIAGRALQSWSSLERR
jgi:hypothetical protein